MDQDAPAVIRTCAELARRIAHELHEGQARDDLLQIADDLEAEADKMERASPPY